MKSKLSYSIAGILSGSSINAAYATAPDTPVVEAPPAELQEILVTAQRRKETIQDVPYNITVVDPAQVSASGATTLNDLTRVVPGLVTVDTGEGARGRTNNLTLRGEPSCKKILDKIAS